MSGIAQADFGQFVGDRLIATGVTSELADGRKEAEQRRLADPIAHRMQRGVFHDDGRHAISQCRRRARRNHRPQGMPVNDDRGRSLRLDVRDRVCNVIANAVATVRIVGFAVPAKVKGMNLTARGKRRPEGLKRLPAARDAMQHQQGTGRPGRGDATEVVSANGKPRADRGRGEVGIRLSHFWGGKAIDYDQRFHEAIAVASGNRRLAGEIRRYRLLVRSFCVFSGQIANLQQAMARYGI